MEIALKYCALFELLASIGVVLPSWINFVEEWLNLPHVFNRSRDRTSGSERQVEHCNQYMNLSILKGVLKLNYWLLYFNKTNLDALHHTTPKGRAEWGLYEKSLTV